MKVTELYFPEIKYLSFMYKVRADYHYCLIYYAAKHKSLAV